ncbi:hypothetical protein A2U10_08565 [Fusobacterium necrophorum subsp. funduliforme]|uniref:Uncharacterized protein n=4 Tax=Fusobacterium necrophorum TaxID=859 RepID=A0AAN3VXQ5_9FUSO|nr:hypothetical protein [Fusobacterium necrophorum]EHO16853.1 hypothetical protein HMPREF9466_02794 [Fusobacterium necrophorum subsp. funduliforme 1_1_36S]AVQ20180.1 hypothetical protein C4N15_00225 [Fusobacterium necrophorum subsp. funduliforme]AYV95884.1 hypothetical protein BWX37_09755 [Fusobacterium necrophorum subsp. funduliforme]AYZ73816.1 hypothetical protein EGX98_07160 [Fusobacterium necrophorum]AZW08178.1 hypothetical protein EO219_00220 [Fusobacterium necrophorum subsp. necrophorum]
MKIIIEEKVKKYMEKNQISALVIEMTPVGCSCVGIHKHAEPSYLEKDRIEEYQNTKTHVQYLLEKNLVFIEKTLLPCEEIVVLGTHNPFNKKIYLHCEIK